ncbi:hypothetical protein BKA57DRAFT_305598 [Linnemannia elongata]|nr:hypothetical protein BKA57DRAFT_305598 [Linnemannia elongata]
MLSRLAPSLPLLQWFFVTWTKRGHERGVCWVHAFFFDCMALQDRTFIAHRSMKQRVNKREEEIRHGCIRSSGVHWGEDKRTNR